VRVWAQRLTGPERFEVYEVPAPSVGGLGPGEVLVRMLAGGVCGSDLPFYRGGTSPAGTPTEHGFGRAGFPMHEVVGEVLASRHADHAAGDQVVGWASAFDALAELVVTDGEGLAGYDRSLAPAAAILLQPLACVLYAVEQVGDVAGASVAVLGQGPMGLLFSHVAAAAGARRVIGVDRVDRSELGALFGVDEVVHAPSDRWVAGLRDSDRPDIVIEAIGHQAATINHAIDAARPGGQIYYFGVPDEPSYAVNLRGLLRKNLTLRSGATWERRRMLAAADDYLRQHPALAETYVTDVLPVDDAQAAFTRALRPAPSQAKIVITAP
jgi:threonine dehydrogenase-like Zn-dependent dehydrogenase